MLVFIWLIIFFSSVILVFIWVILFILFLTISCAFLVFIQGCLFTNLFYFPFLYDKFLGH